MVNSELVHFINTLQWLLRDEEEADPEDYLAEHCI